MNSEEAVDGVEDLIDIDMFLDDDNFLPIAFDWLFVVAVPFFSSVNRWPISFIFAWETSYMV